MARRESKKTQIIKHAPLRPYVHTELDTTLYIKTNTPFISAIKRIEKMILKFDDIPNKKGTLVRRGNISKKTNYITVKGMGKSINKVINIGLHFKFEENFQVDIFTKSVGVLDEFVQIEKTEDQEQISKKENGNDGEKEEEEEEEELVRKRNVGAVEVRVYL